MWKKTLKLWFGTKSKLSSHGTVTSVLGGGGQCFTGVVVLEHLLPGCWGLAVSGSSVSVKCFQQDTGNIKNEARES